MKRSKAPCSVDPSHPGPTIKGLCNTCDARVRRIASRAPKPAPDPVVVAPEPEGRLAPEPAEAPPSLGLDERNAMVADNVAFVHFIVRKYVRKDDRRYDDLVQEGSLGMMIAASKFDPSRGVKFTTFAAYQIRSRISEALRSDRRIVAPPKSAGARAMSVMAKHKVGSADELAEMAQLSSAVAEPLFLLLASTELSTERRHSTGESYEWLRSDSDPEREAIDVVDTERLREIVESEIAKLPAQQIRMIRERFYSDVGVVCQADVAEALGVSRQSVHQLQGAAFWRLKPRLKRRLAA